MNENKFQSALIKELKLYFDFVIKLDPTYMQGIPDLLILKGNKWATLECKKNNKASKRPNQEFYVNKMNQKGFSRFIYPENKNQILKELKSYFEEGEKDMKKGTYFKEGAHALFSASKYNWINYDDDKMIEMYVNSNAKKEGTELHTMCAYLIDKKRTLPDDGTNISNYVNDCIAYNMEPEKQLYYSDLFFGTADALNANDRVLKIFDLKTGKTKASIKQLYIYTAYYLLMNNLFMRDFDDILLRIYQGGEIIEEHPTADVICPIIDKIIRVNDIIQKMKED